MYRTRRRIRRPARRRSAREFRSPVASTCVSSIDDGCCLRVAAFPSRGHVPSWSGPKSGSGGFDVKSVPWGTEQLAFRGHAPAPCASGASHKSEGCNSAKARSIDCGRRGGLAARRRRVTLLHDHRWRQRRRGHRHRRRRPAGGRRIGAVLLGAIVLAYLLGRRLGRRAERRRWERRIAGEARKLGRARDAVRRALDKSGER